MNKIGTIEDFRQVLKDGLSLDDVSKSIIKAYKNNNELNITKICNDLSCSVFCTNFEGITLYTTYKAKCIIGKGAEISRAYGTKYAIAIRDDLSITEQRFLLAYSLGFILLNKLERKNFSWISNYNNLNEDCYNFAIKLLLPFIKK